MDAKGDTFWAGSGWDFESGSVGGSLSPSYPVYADTFVGGYEWSVYSVLASKLIVE